MDSVNKSKKERLKELIGMDDRPVMLFVIPLMGFAIPLLFFDVSLANGLMAYLPHALIATSYSVIYWFTVRTIILYFRKKFPRYKQTGKRIIYSFLVIAPVYAFANFALKQLHNRLHIAEEPNVTDWDYNVVSILLILLVWAIYESVWLYTRWKASIIEQEKLRREYVQSQLEGLRSQVNPHFLFNSLNTLTWLISEDSDKAVKFVQKLSKVYRYVLEIRDKQLVTLEEELTFLQAYEFLIKERFGDNLKVSVEVPQAFHAQLIIPLSLQMLFENATKHNIISEQKPLEITLWVEDQRLLVRNNLQRKAQSMPSTEVGLENIRHRYSFYTQKEVEILETETYFLVTLPLISEAILVPHQQDQQNQ